MEDTMKTLTKTCSFIDFPNLGKRGSDHRIWKKKEETADVKKMHHWWLILITWKIYHEIDDMFMQQPLI